jgi:hypothetical protein
MDDTQYNAAVAYLQRRGDLYVMDWRSVRWFRALANKWRTEE